MREYEAFAKELESDSKNATQEVDSKNTKESQKKMKLSYQQKRLLEILPQEIESLEMEIKELEKLLFSGSLSTQELQEKSLEFESKKAICEEKITQYLELEEKEASL